MASWSSRRRFTYGTSALLTLVLFVGLPLFFFFYTAPTCSDGKKNGNELDIDCGGACQRLCQNSFLSPKVAWGSAKFEKIAPGLYNVAAYIINQNISGAALNVPYLISLYDDKGVLITERVGKVTLQAHRNSLAFESAIDTNKRIPVKAVFEFTAPPQWFKSYDTLEGFSVTDKKYTEDENGSALEVSITNRTLVPYKDVTVGVVLYDDQGNAIGFSQTVIDVINPKGDIQIAPYTWPVSRGGKVTTIEVMPLVRPPSVDSQ